MKGTDFLVTLAREPGFARLSPALVGFLRQYLAHEKVIAFRGQQVLNTHFPPYPSPAFARLVRRLAGAEPEQRLYSVTLAVTNRCRFTCWHCYNAGRCQDDLPLAVYRRLVPELVGRGAIRFMLTGGEPLLRRDLEDLCGLFDERVYLAVGTTGWGLTAARAARLRAAGVFALGVSLDSEHEAEHDAGRGRPGAFRQARRALRLAGDAGLYPYAVTVATHNLLAGDRFRRFVAFAGACGAREVHVLEPSLTGRLAGRRDVALTSAETRRIITLQAELATAAALPIVSSFAYLEGAGAFGCGAGLTHLYVDGSGEVCPCNLVPLAFGNAAREPLGDILARLGRHFCQLRCHCAGKALARHVPTGALPTPPAVSAALCRAHLPAETAVPAFVRAQAAATAAGGTEVRAAYERVSGDYDAFWLTKAGAPVDKLVAQLGVRRGERVFEAGCGTGYGTAQLVAAGARVTASDLSGGMLAAARRRLGPAGGAVEWIAGDALAALARRRRLDLVFTTWVLGYVPLAPFFAAARRALRPGGRLAFVVHRDGSPREPLEIFSALVAQDPAALRQRVAFDFPPDAAALRRQLAAAGFRGVSVQPGQAVFAYPRPADVLEHLLKSGAGTVFHDAVVPARRPALRAAFVRELAARHPAGGPFPVVHDYFAVLASVPAHPPG